MIPGSNPLQAASNQLRQQLIQNRAARLQPAYSQPVQSELNAMQGYQDVRAMNRAIGGVGGGGQGDLQAEQEAVQQHADEQAMQHAYQQAEPHLQALAPNHPLNILVHHLARRAYEASQGY